MSEENRSVSLDMLVSRLNAADQELRVALSKRKDAFAHLRGLLTDESSVSAATILSNLDLLAESGDFDVAHWAGTLANDLASANLEHVVVSGSEPLKTWDQARAIFGHQIDCTFENDPRDVLIQCVENENTAGVAGWITSAGSGQWWPMLNESKFHDLRITGAWPVISDDPPLAAIIAKGPLGKKLGQSTLLIAHDDHHKVERIFNEIEMEVTELSRARSLVLFQTPIRLEENDPRLQAAKVSGLDGLRIVGALPKLNF